MSIALGIGEKGGDVAFRRYKRAVYQSRGSAPILHGAGEWRPSKRVLPVLPYEPRYGGIGGRTEADVAATLAAGARRRPERVHSGKFNAKSSSESEFACGATLGCKSKPLDSDGNVARYAEHGERDIGLEMGRKRRIDFADRSTVRNGIGEAKPGDKLLAAAEYEPGFYTSGGGVLAGSNFGGFNPEPYLLRRKQGRGAADAGEARLLGFGERPPPARAPGTYKRLTLEQRRKAQALRDDIAAVTQLNPAGTGSDSSDDEDDEAVRAMHESIALGRAGAIALGSTAGDIRGGLAGAGAGRDVQTKSWEEETGCFVVKPRDNAAGAESVGDAGT